MYIGTKLLHFSSVSKRPESTKISIVHDTYIIPQTPLSQQLRALKTDNSSYT